MKGPCRWEMQTGNYKLRQTDLTSSAGVSTLFDIQNAQSEYNQR
jgi:hypothetical protein